MPTLTPIAIVAVLPNFAKHRTRPQIQPTTVIDWSTLTTDASGSVIVPKAVNRAVATVTVSAKAVPAAPRLVSAVAIALSSQAILTIQLIRSVGAAILSLSAKALTAAPRFVGKITAAIASRAWIVGPRFISKASTSLASQALNTLQSIRSVGAATIASAICALSALEVIRIASQAVATLALSAKALTTSQVIKIASQATATIAMSVRAVLASGTIKIASQALATIALATRAVLASSRLGPKAGVAVSTQIIQLATRLVPRATVSLLSRAVVAAAKLLTKRTVALLVPVLNLSIAIKTLAAQIVSVVAEALLSPLSSTKSTASAVVTVVSKVVNSLSSVKIVKSAIAAASAFGSSSVVGTATDTIVFSSPTVIDATVPSGLQSNDVLVAFLRVAPVFGGTIAPVTITPPAGWTVQREDTLQPAVGGTFGLQIGLYTHLVTSPGGEPTTYRWSLSSGGNVDAFSIEMISVRGCSGLDTDVLSSSNVDVNTFNANGITVAGNNEPVLIFAAASTDAGAQTLSSSIGVSQAGIKGHMLWSTVGGSVGSSSPTATITLNQAATVLAYVVGFTPVFQISAVLASPRFVAKVIAGLLSKALLSLTSLKTTVSTLYHASVAVLAQAVSSAIRIEITKLIVVAQSLTLSENVKKTGTALVRVIAQLVSPTAPIKNLVSATLAVSTRALFAAPRLLGKASAILLAKIITTLQLVKIRPRASLSFVVSLFTTPSALSPFPITPQSRVIVDSVRFYLPEMYYEDPYTRIVDLFALPATVFDTMRNLILQLPDLVDLDKCPPLFFTKLTALIGLKFGVGTTQSVMLQTALNQVAAYQIRGTPGSVIRVLRYLGAQNVLLYPTKDRTLLLSRALSTISHLGRIQGSIWRPGVFEIITDLDESLWIASVQDVVPAGKRFVPIITQAESWMPNTDYALGQFVLSSDYTGHLFRCVVPGVSGTNEPVWPPTGQIVSDNGLLWQDYGLVTDLIFPNRMFPTIIMGQ